MIHPDELQGIEWITQRSYINCHAIGVDSLMINEDKRVFFAHGGKHTLWKNFETRTEEMSVGFHPHHCDLLLTSIIGNPENMIVEPAESGERFRTFLYESGIHGKCKFRGTGYEVLRTVCVSQFKRVIMPGWTLHTIGVHKNETAAWSVEEGDKWDDYVPICYSNARLNQKDFRDLYQPMTIERCRGILYEITS